MSLSQFFLDAQDHEIVRMETDAGMIEGALDVPRGARGIVLFAHGSGSSRLSPRNRFVAAALEERDMGTLLLDLLTPSEDRVDAVTTHYRFDIELLARRLLLATEWLEESPATRQLPICYFGASTGAAAALMAAAVKPNIAAIVSRGGRPDLAGEMLADVRAPTLFIVGACDYEVIGLNRAAFARLERCRDKELAVVPHATHLFAEPGALEEVARLTGRWFESHLSAAEEKEEADASADRP
jgi:dienelactone hydrolase